MRNTATAILPVRPQDLPETDSQSLGDQARDLADAVWAWPWIDLCGLVLGLGFLILGLRHGFGWQLARLGAVAIAFLGAAAFGPRVGRFVGPTVVPSDLDHAAPLLGASLVFLGFLLVAGMLFSIFRRTASVTEDEEHDLGPGFGSRVLGGGLGLLTGASLSVAVLLMVHVSAQVFDLGNGWVEAAEPSRSRALGSHASEALRKIMPEGYDEGAELLHREFEVRDNTGQPDLEPRPR